MSVKLISNNNINVANLYFLCYSDLDFWIWDFFMLFTNMEIKWHISQPWIIFLIYVCMCLEHECGTTSHGCKMSCIWDLNHCFVTRQNALTDGKMKLLWKLFSHLTFHSQLFWALPKTGILHLQRDVRRCQDVDLSFLSFLCKWDSIVKMTRFKQERSPQ